jgi:UDP-2-acetamido-2-deoxy-ribo-hexuluronate aminotransferase
MLNDLDIYNRSLNKKILKKLELVINENNFIFGDSVKKLENNLIKLTKSKYVITVASGTDALFLSLLCLNLKKKDEIIIPSFSWLSVLEVVLILGLKPVFVDTNIDDFNSNIDSIEKKISKNTKVIISTSLFGRSNNLFKLKRICANKKITLIEDAAQNFGSKIRNKDSCTIADISCTSFFPSKNLGCYGDGGAIFTNNKKFDKKIRLLRNHGQKKYNESDLVGVNSRIGTLQSAVLLEKLKDFKNKKKKQQNLYKKYDQFFSSYKIIGYPKIRNNKNFNDAVCQFSLIVKKRASFIKHLKKNKINFKIYYSKPLYKQFNLNTKVNFKNTEFISKHIISLPFNDLSLSRFSKVIFALKKIIKLDKGIFFEKK